MERAPKLFPVIMLALCLSPRADGQVPLASSPLLPTTLLGERLFLADQGLDAVLVLQDLNQDGDANDAGEITTFYDTTSPDPALHLATPQYVVYGIDKAVYVGDSNKDFILRLEDLDGDGTANQAGEAAIYYDNLSGGPELVSINNMVVDVDGYLYFSDNGTSSSTDKHVIRIRDDDGDGYCSQEVGEVHVIYELSTTTGVSVARPSGMLIDADGTLLVSNYDDDTIYRFVDTADSEDGAANSEGEQKLVFESLEEAVSFTFVQSMVIGLEDGEGNQALYANDFAQDTIFRMVDSDGDGVYQNPEEITVFWSPDQADGIVPGVAWRLAIGPGGALFVAEGGSGDVEEKILRLEDKDGDGSANGAGEVTVYCDLTNADGVVLDKPYGLAFEAAPPPPVPVFVRGDSNADGAFDLSDPIHLLDFLFLGGPPPPCRDAADAGDDGELTIASAVYSLGALFAGGGLPPAPHPACGADETEDPLGCDAFPPCDL